jgi:D-aminoacyl-tRNA deacylase
MRLIIQRVLSASVSVKGETVSSIGQGLMVLMGLNSSDDLVSINSLSDKLLKLRLWRQDPSLPESPTNKPWSTNVMQNNFSLLIVSQFTLYTILKGNKPDFHQALENTEALSLYNEYIEILKSKYREDKIEKGAFGKYMNIHMVGDGPVTIVLESPEFGLKEKEKLMKKAQREQGIRENLKRKKNKHKDVVKEKEEEIKKESLEEEEEEKLEKVLTEEKKGREDEVIEEENKISLIASEENIDLQIK